MQTGHNLIKDGDFINDPKQTIPDSWSVVGNAFKECARGEKSFKKKNLYEFALYSGYVTLQPAAMISQKVLIEPGYCYKLVISTFSYLDEQQAMAVTINNHRHEIKVSQQLKQHTVVFIAQEFLTSVVIENAKGGHLHLKRVKLFALK